MSARIYVEGGGDSKELITRCREGFRRLLERSGFEGRMPRLVACGARNSAFEDFCTAHQGNEADFVALLVDSEDPVADGERPWDHLRARDEWHRPESAHDDQALLMITCMETWIACDREALRDRFGPELHVDALPALQGIEARTRQDVLGALKHASRDCAAQYAKGKLSFELLAGLSPDALRANAPAFGRVLRILDQRL